MGKGAEGQVSAKRQLEVKPAMLEKQFAERWVQIGDVEYNVTDFKHPGGSVINYALSNTGADATEVFREFHHRSAKAKKYLKSLPNRPAKVKRSSREDYEVLQSFDEFRSELEKDGFFEPSPAHVAYRIVEVIAMFAFATYLISQGWTIASVLTFGVTGARCGWIQHEGGHGSLTGNNWMDKRIQAAFIGFGLSTSGLMWNSMHQKHHATPQKVEHDMDLDTLPLVAFFKTAAECSTRTKSLNKFWVRLQAWTFLPVTSGFFVMLFWILYLHPRKVVRDRDYEGMFWMASSHVIKTWLLVHYADYSIPAAYGMYWLMNWVGGMYLFGHFSTSHTFLETVESYEHKNWVEYAVNHTIDINTQNPLVNWVMGYLNCQVVHHLFPQMPQYRQPEVSKRLDKWVKQHPSLNYRQIGYFEAWYRMFKNLNDVGIHYQTVDVKKRD